MFSFFKRLSSAVLLTTILGSNTAPVMPAIAAHALAGNAGIVDEQWRVADRLAKTFAATWNARDGRAYGEAYWPDAELVDPSGAVWTGRGAIIKTHVDLWDGPARATRMVAHVRRVRYLSPSLFVVDIDTAANGFSPPPPGAPDGIVRTRLKHVVEKRGDGWRIVSSQNTFIAAPRPVR